MNFDEARVFTPLYSIHGATMEALEKDKLYLCFINKTRAVQR